MRRILPNWLLNPIVVPASLTNRDNLTSVDDISYIDEMIRNKLKKLGITLYFPIQSRVIPLIYNAAFQKGIHIFPQDILVSAPTGSGKTLTYVLPLLEVCLVFFLHIYLVIV